MSSRLALQEGWQDALYVHAFTFTLDGPQRQKHRHLHVALPFSLQLLNEIAIQAKTAVAPLDRVKILFQASSPQFAKYTGSYLGALTAMREIYSSEGARGLLRGHSATLLRIFPYAAIKFQAYEQIRAAVIKGPEQETAGRRLFCGSAAGMTSVGFTYPLEVIRVRLAFETKGGREGDGRKVGLKRIVKQIYHEQQVKAGTRSRVTAATPSSSISSSSSYTTSVPSRSAATLPSAAAATTVAETLPSSPVPRYGLTNFYRGFSPTLFGMLPYAGMSFLTHDTMHDILRYPSLVPYTTLPTATTPSYLVSSSSQSTSQSASPPRPRLKSWAQLLAGALAGLVSQTSAYPFEVIRRRMQVGGAVGDGHRLGMGEVARQVWMERGWRGFFVGLGVGYAKVVPMVSVSFWVYERGKGWLGV